MKKFFSTVMLMCLVTVGYCNTPLGNPSELFNKPQTPDMYNFTNFNVLGFDHPKMKLDLSDDQAVKVESIMKEFSTGMQKSFYSKNRKKHALKVINKNIEKMYVVLDSNQYRNYLRILNYEVAKRGVDIY